MLTHLLASLKESICEKMFPITYTPKLVFILPPPASFLAVSNSLVLVNCKKCIFRTLQILLTAGFLSYYYEIYSFIHSFIHSFIEHKQATSVPLHTTGITHFRYFLHHFFSPLFIYFRRMVLNRLWGFLSYFLCKVNIRYLIYITLCFHVDLLLTG